MSALVQPVRPGFVYGERPERRVEAPISELDHTIARWLQRSRGSRLTVKRFRPTLQRIEHIELELKALSENEFGRCIRRLRNELVHGEMNTDAMTRALATIRVAAHNVLGMRPHPEQLYAGWAMMHGAIVEMNTGEGKTLTAALPAIATALTGAPVHVVTVNEYLVTRDAAKLKPLYAKFGLRVATVTDQMNDDERRTAYAADIVYCTNKQIVFDYLRDLQTLGGEYSGLKGEIRSLLDVRPAKPLLRGLSFAIVDEADSVLIDDARTPLILAQSRKTGRTKATEAAVALSIGRTLVEGADFQLQQDSRSVWLTDTGLDALRNLGDRLTGVWRFERYRNELIRQALSALHLFRLDRDYLVREGKIALVDESTGRVMSDRKLQHGLHRMLEVKERCEITEENEVIAALSFQRFFPRYCHLSGMSGTVNEVSAELSRVYGADVVRVPSHKPSRRQVNGPMVLADRTEQLACMLREVKERHAVGQPVLIGTRSVEMSERVSDLLHASNIRHELLNARQDADEAEIIARGGLPRSVTVATNMAGRGTDIPLRRNAADLGGLHVINLEINESARVDRQLYGRSARQGDPGSCRAILSLKDELIVNVIPEKVIHLLGSTMSRWPFLGQRLARLFVSYAQQRCERDHAQQRTAVFKGHEQLRRQLAIGGDRE